MSGPSPSSQPQTQQTQSSSGDSSSTSPNALSWAIAILVLGTSAGFTLYTKRAGSMLSRIEQVTEREIKRKGPNYKIGPHTRSEWDKITKRTGSNKEDIF